MNSKIMRQITIDGKFIPFQEVMLTPTLPRMYFLHRRASSHAERHEGEAEILVLVLACFFLPKHSEVTQNDILFPRILVTSLEENPLSKDVTWCTFFFL